MTGDRENRSELGRWANGDFETTVSKFSGIGAEAGIPDENRFVAGVVQLLLRRRVESAESSETDSSDIAIFVLKPSPPESIPNLPRVPMLDNGRTKVVGRLWFTSAAVISAYSVELPEDHSDDGRFSFVTDELELGSLPTLLFDPRPISPQLRWYPAGLSQPDKVELKPLDGDVSPEAVFEAIEELFQECFITPTSMPQGMNLWHEAAKNRPKQEAETLIQSHLKAGLVLRFPYCKVRHEVRQQAGRTDIEIEQVNAKDRSIVTRHAIIELKVLRSFGSSGNSVPETQAEKHIEEGVRQALAYRHNKNARWSALCCFDMRRDDVGDSTCFAQVKGFADSKEVLLRRWFLYASSSAYRKATTSP